MSISFDAASFANFITREGDQLFDGKEEFRFISINIPNLHVNEDPLPHWHRIDPWEIEDAFKTIRLMEGRATRIYTFSIRGGLRPGSNGIAHIYGPDNYDEQLFCDLDLVLALAAKHGIRVIIPFIDQWHWFGGIEHFSAFFHKSPKQFWTDSEIRQAFKNFITFVINRTNTVTGLPYKQDKTILAWETGNELDSPDEWITDIVSHIRSLDVKQLILDGRYGVSPASLDNPDIDIVSNHYYIDRGKDFMARITADRNLARGKKAFLIGEFGHKNPQVISDLLDMVVSNGTTGALAWSLRYHNKDGGFYYQGDPISGENHCLNWPGFTGRPGEIEKLTSLRQHAYLIQGKTELPNPVPDPPQLLPIWTPAVIAWRGAAGASFYTIERAVHASGPWSVIADDVHEHGVKYVPFSDTPPSPAAYHYRMCSGNENGLSVPSNVETVQYEMQSVHIDKAIPLPDTNANRFKVAPALIDSKAAPYTRRLMNYLCDSYGHQILAGQQTGGSNPPELDIIARETGKLPAIRGLDFMDYSPSRLPFGASSAETEEAIAWWREGGIVTFCWHWNAPKDLINLPDKMWYSGFYTNATEFDLAKAMEDPESEDYYLLLQDIDAIALQLQILQEHEIPVLWRPLHEAAGGWFWWGAKGPEACIKLWRLMVERLTVHHQLHNLIWVWNGQAKEWYPGDDVVDIIGEDIYGGPRVYNSQYGRFHGALGYTQANKMIALTENGTIPDPDLILRDEAVWAWFCTWEGEFMWKAAGGEKVHSDKHTELDMLRKVYSHSKVITRDKLPDLTNYRL